MRMSGSGMTRPRTGSLPTVGQPSNRSTRTRNPPTMATDPHTPQTGQSRIYDCDKGLRMWPVVDVLTRKTDPDDDETWRGCPCGWERGYDEKHHAQRHSEW